MLPTIVFIIHKSSEVLPTISFIVYKPPAVLPMIIFATHKPSGVLPTIVFVIYYPNKLGNNNENIRIHIPDIKTMIVFLLTPFHSFNTIPHTLLNMTFSDIRILHEKASMTGESAK